MLLPLVVTVYYLLFVVTLLLVSVNNYFVLILAIGVQTLMCILHISVICNLCNVTAILTVIK